MLISADVGETPQDKEFMPFLDIANIACGYHAGDETSITKMVLLAKKYLVKISAHLSYQDRKNFGRKSIFINKTTLRPQLLTQLQTIDKICKINDLPLVFVKPHGALYNDITKIPAVLEAVAETIAEYNQQLLWIFFATKNNAKYIKIAKKYGLKLLFESFADREYDKGFLKNRKEKGAIIKESSEIIKRVHLLREKNTILNELGKKEKLSAQTICFHGDNPASLVAIKILKNGKNSNLPC